MVRWTGAGCDVLFLEARVGRYTVYVIYHKQVNVATVRLLSYFVVLLCYFEREGGVLKSVYLSTLEFYVEQFTVGFPY